MRNKRTVWLNCIKNYRFHSIFLKNLGLISGVIFIPFLCIIGISTYAYDALQKSEERAYVDEWASRISMNVKSIFDGISDKAVLLSANEDVELFFFADTVGNDMFYDTKNIVDLLTVYNISTDIIDSIYLYAPYSGGIISTAGRRSYENFDDKECIDCWVDNGERYQFEYLNRRVVGAKKETLTVYYTTYLGAGRKGVIIINIDMKKLAKELEYGDEVRMEIVGNGKMLYDSTGEANGSKIESVQALIQNDDETLTVYNELEQFGIEFMICIQSADLYAKLGTMREILVGVVLVMLLISILLVFYISQKIFNPISEMISMLETTINVKENEILQNKNELECIRAAISSTLSKNKTIAEELLDRVKLMKKAQAVALQAQINPHFMNNTLENINWMAIKQYGGENDVSEMLNCLSQILRYSLEDTDTFVSLQEELVYVEKYLFIQKKRINQDFDVIWRISPELLACKMIKMILQPVIENAINYGIKPYHRKGRLEIEAVRMQDTLCIRVKDSGLGIKALEAEKINRSIRAEVIKESSHIGLTNVHQRIVLAFGYNYGVTVWGEIGRGTLVELELPYQV